MRSLYWTLLPPKYCGEAGSRGGDLLFEQRVHDDRRASGILEPPHRVEMIDQWGCANDELMGQTDHAAATLAGRCAQIGASVDTMAAAACPSFCCDAKTMSFIETTPLSVPLVAMTGKRRT